MQGIKINNVLQCTLYTYNAQSSNDQCMKIFIHQTIVAAILECAVILFEFTFICFGLLINCNKMKCINNYF